jgi:hypothetical protein
MDCRVKPGNDTSRFYQSGHDSNQQNRPPSVMAGHSRSKNGVASLAYVPAIHVLPDELY